MNTTIDSAPDFKKGLEGVIAGTTAVSDVAGATGTLCYRGFRIESLIERSFAEVAYLIVFGELPTASKLATFEEQLWQAARLPPTMAVMTEQLARTRAHPMQILQAIAALLADDAPRVSMGRTAAEQEGLTVAARLPTALALIQATRQGRLLTDSPSRNYGERYLQLLTGDAPTKAAVRAFETTQILQLEHGFNAGTFTARVAGSTLTPAASVIGSALGALYGPLHGGADQAVLEMAETVGSPSNARAYVASALAQKRVVMGMGHREYRLVDPRAALVKPLAARLATTPELRALFATLAAVEQEFIAQTTTKSRPLRANLEFYKSILYLAVGVPKDCFTGSFAAARVFGWIAHLVEQRADNRIYRPRALYVGAEPRAL